MKNFIYTLLFTVCAATGIFAQHDWCYSDEVLQQELAKDPAYATELQQMNEAISQPLPKFKGEASAVKTIPVVFHVVYATEYDNISVEQIEDALRILNEDFRRNNPDAANTRGIFQNVAADIEIEFELAKKDPNGNCTDGITRTKSNLSLVGNNSVKDLVNWDRTKYYNIWVTRNVANTKRGDPNGVTLGYSYFPRAVGQSYRTDGTIIRHDALGSTGVGTFIHSNSRTLTHETGHYLALYHPFDNGGSGSGCNSGDFCQDTPPVDKANFQCFLGVNSCNNDNPDRPDQIENYMDYAECKNMFTQDQKTRMVNVINNSSLRGNLVSNSNLNFTGVLNPPGCPPEAKFEAEKRFVCLNEPLQFYDRTEEGQPSSWKWTFEEGNPANSTQQNPVVTYSKPGLYKVTLESSNNSGSDSLTQTEYVYVKSSDAPFHDKLWVQSFEQNYIPFTHTVLDVGGDGTQFTVTNQAASHGSHSIVLNSDPDLVTEVDELISPALSTTGGNNLNLYFDFAFAARSNQNDDLLEVYVSRDCGATWNLRRRYFSSLLRTASNTNGTFTPQAGDWVTNNINFDSYVQNEPILIKFVFTNGGGNRFFLDNIRFGEGTDVSLNERAGLNIQAYPNPGNGLFNLKIRGSVDRQLELKVTDISGRTILRKALELEQSNLETKIQINSAPGLYFLEVNGQNTEYSTKLMVQ